MPADSWPRCWSAKSPKYVSRETSRSAAYTPKTPHMALRHPADLDEAARAEQLELAGAIASTAAPLRGSAGSSTSASRPLQLAASARACSSPP